MQAKTRTWQRPELTVLVRNRPEEAVLAACKLAGGTGPDKKDCRAQTGPPAGLCSDNFGS